MRHNTVQYLSAFCCRHKNPSHPKLYLTPQADLFLPSLLHHTHSNDLAKMKTFHKVVFKPDSQSTDEFMVIVNGDEYKKWIKGDKTIPLADVVDSFDVFHTGTGAQGIMGRPSKQLLDTVFDTHKDVDVVTHILERGQLQTASHKDAYSTTNDAKQGQNTTSHGSGGGFGGR